MDTCPTLGQRPALCLLSSEEWALFAPIRRCENVNLPVLRYTLTVCVVHFWPFVFDPIWLAVSSEQVEVLFWIVFFFLLFVHPGISGCFATHGDWKVWSEVKSQTPLILSFPKKCSVCPNNSSRESVFSRTSSLMQQVPSRSSVIVVHSHVNKVQCLNRGPHWGNSAHFVRAAALPAPCKQQPKVCVCVCARAVWLVPPHCDRQSSLLW